MALKNSGSLRNIRDISPASILQRQQIGERRFKRLRRWKDATLNWLNGLPVRQEDDLDGTSLRGGAGGERRKQRERQSTVASSTRSSVNPKTGLKRKEQTEAGKTENTIDPEAALHSATSLQEGDKMALGGGKDAESLDFQEREPVRVIQLPPEPYGGLPTGHQHDDVHSMTVSNEILTAKYTVLNFLPKNLLEQMRRVANVYFVFIILLQCVPGISNYNPILAASPVVAIMAVTAIKDAVEDWRRHQQDNEVNYSTCLSLHRQETGPTIARDTRYQRLVDFMWRLRDGLILSVTRAYCRLKGKTFELEGRHRQLAKLNADTVDWQETFWRDIRVGDIVLLRNNEMIPADIVLLSSSEPDGVCFVETKNLDGETNLKLKRSPYETAWIQTAADTFYIKATIEVELPHVNLYSFNGRIIISKENYEPTDDHLAAGIGDQSCSNDGAGPSAMSLVREPTSKDQLMMVENALGEDKDESHDTLGFVEPTVIPIGSDALLLRGCVLRNTPFAIGVVAYTGPHTKLMMNSGGTPSKRTRIERQMNPQIILIFVLLFIICLSCAVVQAQLASSTSSAPYWTSSFQDGIMSSSAFLGFLTFFSSLILFQTLVPISMYVTLEMVKTVQAFFINNDVMIYHPESDRRAVPRAWNLADDLGQIEYLFSDKTGTLTENVMEFRRCSIDGQVYGYLPSSMSPTEWDSMEEVTIKAIQSVVKYEYVPPSRFTFVDPLIYDVIQGTSGDKEHREKLIYFFLALIVCHTVLIDQSSPVEGESPDDLELCKGKGGLAPHLFFYKAQSPDEAALVAAARDLGFVFLGRDQHNLIYVSLLGEFETITVLHVLEFNSDRKRMSTIIRRGSGDIILLCKGADNVIYERLSPISAESGEARITQGQLESFAEDGLRTLCVAHRRLDPVLYQTWLTRYSEASASITDRDMLTALLCDEIESNLTLLGATAIEDRLQEGVPECIEIIQRAGIKIWVLTGDKLETAINIGFSCQLLTKHMVLLVIRATGTQGDGVEETLLQLRNAYERIWSRHFNFGESSTVSEFLDPLHLSFALIIEGSTLKFALEDARCRKLFLKLATKCVAVICCRVSPLQKATVVDLVRRGKNVMTMAIGDGANDVSMIQAADVGVGIAGQEGMQAVMSSDYAIAQFRFLERLLLVHGRWAYIRAAEVILCSLYKNVAFVVLLYWYQFYCGFTAQYIYDYMYLLFFNIFFSILPLLVLGFLERDLPARRLQAVPQLYRLGVRQSSFNMLLFLLYLLDGLYQSIVCFWVPLLAYSDTAITWTGYPETQTLLGNVMALSIIICTNLYMALNTLSWVAYSFVGIGLTILAVISFLLVYSFIPSEALYGSWRDMIDPVFWATILLSITLALAPRLLLKYLQVTFRPSDLDVVREVHKFHWGEADLARCSDGKREGDPPFDARITDLGQLEAVIPAPTRAAHREYTRKPLGGWEPPVSAIASPPTSPSIANNSNNNGGRGTEGGSASLMARGRKERPSFLERSLALFNLRTNRFERLRGFAFSQEDGMGEVIGWGLQTSSRDQRRASLAAGASGGHGGAGSLRQSVTRNSGLGGGGSTATSPTAIVTAPGAAVTRGWGLYLQSHSHGHRHLKRTSVVGGGGGGGGDGNDPSERNVAPDTGPLPPPWLKRQHQ